MSLPSSAPGIPFPQSGEQSPLLGPLRGSGRVQAQDRSQSGMQPGKERQQSKESVSSHPLMTANSSSSLREAKSSHSASYSSSSSSKQGESLPSIRNLLNSIEHESSGHPSQLMRRSPSAPNLPSINRSDTQDNLPELSHNNHPRQTANSVGQHWNTHERLGSGTSWESHVPLRSMSPQRRPPIAPSAFAHNQYGNASFRPETAAGNYHRHGQPLPPPNRNHWNGYPTTNQTESNKKQQSLHSPSFSFPTNALTDVNESQMPHHDAGRPKREDSSMTPSTHLTKRTIQSQHESEEPPLSPASSRRRHTVGALEEPIGLHNQVQSQIQSLDAEATPRAQHNLQLRANPGSPTTPTSIGGGNGGHRMSNIRWDSSEHGGVAAPPSSAHNRIYLQHHEPGTGSMPSLASSISTVSLSSERARVHSLEEQREMRGPPPTWSHLGSEGQSKGGSAAIIPGLHNYASPQSSVWHSRSSTLDSIETTSSFGSSQGYHSNPLPPPRSSSLHSEGVPFVEFPTTPTRRMRDSEGGAPYGYMHERARHESLRVGGEFHVPLSMRNTDHPQFSYTPPLPPTDANGYNRPRAQTFAYNDRPIAPLPSHSQPQSRSNSVSLNSKSSRPTRTMSSHSTSSTISLPQRVSSMEIDEDSTSVHSMFDRGMRPPSSSSSRSSTTTTTTTAAALASTVPTSMVSSASVRSISGAPTVYAAATTSSGAKYECHYCGKRFSRPSSLKIHHHSHTGEKPYVCPTPNCGRTFSVQSNLRRHQKCHVVSLDKNVQREEAGVGTNLNNEGRQQQQQQQQQKIRAHHTSASGFPLGAFHQQQQPGMGQVDVLSQSLPTESVMGNARYDGKGSGVAHMGPSRMYGVPSKSTNSFLQSRERRHSSVSSNAEDDDEGEVEEEEEEEEDGEEEGNQETRKREGLYGKIGIINQTNNDDQTMEDIKEEEVPLQTVTEPEHNFQRLLNPRQYQ